MAEKAAELTIVLRARNLLKGALDKAGKQIQQQISNIQKYQNEIRLASKAALAVGVVGATLFTGAIVQAAGFEKQLSAVSAVTKANVADQKRLRDAALEQGSKSVFAASQAAEAQLFLGQAGQSTTQIIQSLDGVLSLAAATSSDLAFTSELTAATLSQFSLEAKESSRVANVFAASASNSQANLNKLAFAMRQAGPDASALGQSLEGTTAALNVFFDLGLKGEQAGTVLRAALVSLANPSTEAAEVLERLEIQIFDTSGKMLPFVDIVEQLGKANLSTIESFKIFGTEAGGKMAKLIAKGSQALREMEEKITGTDEAARQAAVRTDNLAGSYTFLTSAIEGASISIGSEYIPVIRTVTDLLTGFVTGFNDLDPATKSWIANTALAITALTGFMGAIGLLAVSLAASKLALGVLALGLGGLLLIIGKVALGFAVLAGAVVFGSFLAEITSVKLSVLDFFQVFETGWLALELVVNSVIAFMAASLQGLFKILRATVLKPLELIIEGLIEIGEIKINPFDAIESGLDGLQSHTEEVVINISDELDQVNGKYDEMREAVVKASTAQDVLKTATDKTTKSIGDQVTAVDKQVAAQEKSIEKSKALAGDIKKAFELTGLVSTADSVAEMDKLVSATALLLESGELTLDQERDLIKIFGEKANAITGVTKRLDEMTGAANNYNSALDALLAVRLNSLQGDLEKTFGGILDPSSIKKKAEELEAPFGLRRDGTPKGPGFLGVLPTSDVIGGISTELSIGVNIDGKEIDIPTLVPTLIEDEITHLLAGKVPTEAIVQKAVDNAIARISVGKSPFKELSGDIFVTSNLVNTDVLAEYKKQVAEGGDAVLKFTKTQGGLTTSVQRTADGYGALTFSLSATEKKIGDIRGAVRAHQDQLDTLFNGPIEAQQKLIETLKASGASLAQVAQAESRLKEIQSARISAMVAHEEAGLREVKKIREANLKDLQENNDKIQALEKNRADNSEAIKRIDELRANVGVSDEEIRRRQGLNLQNDIFAARGLTGEKKAAALREIAEKGEALARASSAGGNEFNRFLDIAKRARVELEGVQELLAGLAKNNGIEADAARSQTAVASMEEAVDGFNQKLRILQTDIANANLSLAIEMVDNATGPGKEIRNSLQELFNAPIIQEVIVKQTGQIAQFKGGNSIADPTGGFDFQSSSSDLTGFSDNVGSFASGIKFVPQDALVRVHRGETILSRSESAQERRGDKAASSISFSGPIIIQNMQGSVDPRQHAEELFREFEKLVDLKKG